ncbi:hypothetical protein [Salinisphaera orenii]|jgi:hypothetical protein|uniref:Uncharacterized protein n=1 Tax=Salinisphaera orenii YIM 95161 TaxID=1051139 RepID=A0A423PRV1_9GAMM|nr:hypothetical protein [Salinisphaera halophila]ROO28251.1 hypothetical protein SAHL_10365 [Salinisphaera halophila YIM 95161]|tara:strand:+ start:1977 stop:2384 length:408 start_codon:yes stop_codon:yes gene_type:complete
MTKLQITGLAACAAMAFAVFMPILSTPQTSLSLMSSNEVQAYIVLAITAPAAAGFYWQRPIVAVLASLLNLLFVCFLLVIYVGAKTNDDPANLSPVQFMSLSWGWLVIIGAALVMAGAAFKVRADREASASDARA